MPLSFADLLGKYLQREYTSVNRLSKLSGVPQRTIANWLNGVIQKPHQWQSLIKVSLALRLTVVETEELLLSAGHLPLALLSAKANARSDIDLLSSFQIPASKSSFFR